MNTSFTFITLSSLLPNSDYIIRVAGENNAGLGKTSAPIKIRTKHEG